MAQSEYESGLESIKRRRAIAQALQDQSMQGVYAPMSGTGNYPIQTRIQPLQIAAQLGQAFIARKQNQKLDKERDEIAKAMGSDRQKALDALTAPDMGPSYEQDPTQDDSQGPTRMIARPGTNSSSPQNIQNAIDAGIDPSVISAATAKQKGYTGKLSAGEKAFIDGREVAALPPNQSGEGALKVVIGADGKPRYATAADAVGQQAPQNSGVNINVGDKLPAPPQGMAYVKDPTSQFGYKLAPIPGARDSRSESQQKASLLYKRMKELSGDVQNAAPSSVSQQAFSVAQKGGITGALANGVLSEKQQKHFNAARGWLSGILRQDTGATISDSEFSQYYPTYFPVPNDTKGAIEQKRKLREVTEAGMGVMGGNDPVTPGAPPPAPPAGDLDARVQSYYVTPNGQ